MTPSTALWNPQAHMPSVLGHQIKIVRGAGPYVYRDNGDRLLDATSSLWYANVGHAHPALVSAAHEQLRTLESYQIFGEFTSDLAESLADRIAALVPIVDPKVIFNSGGSDAIEVACKLARRYWQAAGEASRTYVLSRDGEYHGLHAFGTSIVGLDFNRAGYGTPSLVPETARVPTHDLAALEETIRTLGPHRVAAVVVEPVLGTGGVVPPAPGYFAGLNRLAAEHGFLVVADEVITGFGRTGEMFASTRFGIEPDIITMAKGLTSGYVPMGGVAVSPRIWRTFFDDPAAPTFHHGVTYSGHATACAVAHANLDVLENEGLVERAALLEKSLVEALRSLEGHPKIAEIRSGCGLLAGVQLQSDVDGRAVMRAALERGVILRVLPGNTLQISPPFVCSHEHMEQIVAAIGAALGQPC